MPASIAPFAFAENGTLAENFAAFDAFTAQIDSLLTLELSKHRPSLVQGEYTTSDVWDALLFAVNSQTPSSVTAAGLSTNHTATGAGGGITGWLLEGVSIEGFRGINNQGKPLELKFHTDKVNSVSAVNGTGKSSVYDAIRFAICGSLKWLDALPASERTADYYLNKFNSSGLATIILKLVAEPNGERVAITVTRDQSGARRVSCVPPTADAAGILESLDREFVLLDGRTFQTFICDAPLDRGRTFAGLLGVAPYNRMRQSLAAVANTRAFNNHFGTVVHAQLLAREEKAIAEIVASIGADHAILVGSDLGTLVATDAQNLELAALSQIGLLKPRCDGKMFIEVDIDACIDAIKQSEGGPKRERLGDCIRERADLKRLNRNDPQASQAAALVVLCEAREVALAQTAGDVMLALFRSGSAALELPSWGDPTVCPLCDQKGQHDLKHHIGQKLSQFDALEAATNDLATRWGEMGWAAITDLEAKLEASAESRLIRKLSPKGDKGEISSDEAKALIVWLEKLRERAGKLDADLASEQAALENELPPSSVELMKKLEAARRLQDNWKRLAQAQAGVDRENSRAKQIARIKRFLDEVSSTFGFAESQLTRARLSAVEPIFKAYFSKLSFAGVTPSVRKPENSEQLQLVLSDFYGLSEVSPTALLSESFRNAFAISLYLAAASLYGGAPKFIVLDDVTSSFDAGHQNFLVELIRTTFGRPANAAGLQVILLSHDTMLEKLFNKHGNTGTWSHQRLEGNPQFAVLPQAGAVNKVRDQTISMLQAGQADFAKEGVRQYLEYRLSDVISRLRIPVPVDVAFNDNKQLSSEFLAAIDAAVKLHLAAQSLVLDATQVAGLNANMVTIVGNFLSHWGTGQALSFSAPALLGVMRAIDDYCNCFMFQPTPGAPLQFYKSLHQRV